MKEKIDFWYESNSYFGRIKNLEDLRIAMSYVVDKKFGQLENKDEFLDLSTQHYSGSMEFGLRAEHSGEKTLREYLTEIGIDINKL